MPSCLWAFSWGSLFVLNRPDFQLLLGKKTVCEGLVSKCQRPLEPFVELFLIWILVSRS